MMRAEKGDLEFVGKIHIINKIVHISFLCRGAINYSQAPVRQPRFCVPSLLGDANRQTSTEAKAPGQILVATPALPAKTRLTRKYHDERSEEGARQEKDEVLRLTHKCF